jgi:cytidylate kinase
MDPDEKALQQFIADRTGFTLNRVVTILSAGAPWPELTLIADRMSQIDRDTAEANVEEHIAVETHLAMFKMGGDVPIDVQAFADNIVRTASLAHEQPEDVAVVRSAMLAFYRQHYKETEERYKALRKKMAD